MPAHAHRHRLAARRPPAAAPHFAADPPPRSPSFFPQLEIYELLGYGGMGMVYKARQLNLDRLVALKILSPELSSQPAFAERFSREAKALARLHHSNIVSVYDFGRAGPYYYFLMEYRGRGGPAHADPAQGTEAARGPAHRAWKSATPSNSPTTRASSTATSSRANILLDKKGRVKMADFGLAKLAGDRRPAPARPDPWPPASWAPRNTWPPNKSRRRPRWTTAPTSIPWA